MNDPFSVHGISRIFRFIILCLFIIRELTMNLYAQDTVSGKFTSTSLIEKGSKLQDEGNYTEALACYALVKKSDPNYPRSLYEAALTLYNDNKPEAALKKCDEALFLQYNIPQLYGLKGSILDDLGRPGEGAAIIDSALKKWPYNQNLLFNMSVCMINLNQPEQAEKVLLKSIRINPFHIGSNLELARANLSMGRIGQAYLAFNMAILLKPSIKNITQYENAVLGKSDTLIHPYRYSYHNHQDSAKWKQLTMILNSGIPFSDDFDFTFQPDYKLEHMSLLLFNSSFFDKEDTTLYNQFYIRFFTGMMKDFGFEIFMNYSLQYVGNEKVKEWMTKHKGQLDDFIKWAQVKINTWKEYGFSNHDEVDGIAHYHYNEQGLLEDIGALNRRTDKKMGEWITLNEDGGIEESGSYSDGKRNGLWQIYY